MTQNRDFRFTLELGSERIGWFRRKNGKPVFVEEIRDWLIHNQIQVFYERPNNLFVVPRIRFTSERHILMFKMRWF